MKPEKQRLIHDLLAEDSSREATLLAGAQVLRRRRHWRAAQRGLGFLVVVALVGVFLWRRENPRPASAQLASVAPEAAPVPQARALTDDELLALFPDTPVGLTSTADGKKRLIFPRAGDKERFIRRL